jgi:hypothetical protein
MPLLDLSLVTQTFVRLLDARVKELLAQNPAITAVDRSSVQVCPLAPGQLTGDASIGWHLYHAADDPHLQSFRPPLPGAAVVGDQPMAWRLHYLLSTRSDLPDAQGAAHREQALLGLAMKALHDYPVIDNATRVGAIGVVPDPLVGADICLRITPLAETKDEVACAGSSNVVPRPGPCYLVSVVAASRRSA